MPREREEVIKKNIDRVKEKKLKKYIEKMLNDIMSVSKEYQETKIFKIKDNNFNADFKREKNGIYWCSGFFRT